MKSESSSAKLDNKPEKHKKSAPPPGNRALYAAVVITHAVVAKKAAIVPVGSETHEPTGKTRNHPSDTAGQKTGTEVRKYPEAKAEPTRTAKATDMPAGATLTGIHAAGDESAKRLGAKEHGKPEMTTAADSKQKPADVRSSAPHVPDVSKAPHVPGAPGASDMARAEAGARAGAGANGTNPSETQAHSPKQAKPSTTAVARAAATVTATMKEAGVQATTTTADPSRHAKGASKATQNPPDPGRAVAATGTAVVTTARVAANTASSSGGGADSGSSHGDKGKNDSPAPKDHAGTDHVGTRQKEANSSSTTFGLAGSTRSTKGAVTTSKASPSIPASGVTAATNASATTAGHTGNAQSAMGQPGSAATIAGHEAPVTRAGTGQAAGVDSGISRIQSARLIGGASRAEMRIHMDTNELGPVQLRASVAGSRVGATISVERPETQSLLASKLGVLHQALSDRNLQVDRIDVVSGSGTNAGGHAGAGTSNGGGRAWQHHAPDSWTGTTSQMQMSTETAAEEITATSSVNASYRAGRLSVRA